MKQNRPITRDEVIGRRIRCVLQHDLPRDPKEEFLECEIVVELESGLRFALERDKEVLDPATGLGFIYPYDGKEGLYSEMDARSNADLNSPIKAIMRPHGYWYNCGLILENGFILIDGYAMTGNGALFMRPCAETMARMEVFELPATHPTSQP